MAALTASSSGSQLAADESELEERVAAGDGYECTQLYIGLIGRLHTAGKFEEANGVGVRGVRALIRANQAPNAKHVAVTIIGKLASRKKSPDVVDSADCDLMLSLVKAFDDPPPPSSSSSSSSSSSMLEQKLIVSKDACKVAGPAFAQLHAIRAADLERRGRYAESAKHYSLAGRPVEHANLLRNWAAKGYLGERDLFVARAVLHVLALAGSVNRQALRLQHGSASAGVEEGGKRTTWWSTKADMVGSARKLRDELSSGRKKGNSTGQQQQQQQQQCDFTGCFGGVGRGAGGGVGSPLVRFVDMVLELLGLVDSYSIGKRGAASAFDLLLRNYAPSLQKRDPRLMGLATKVGAVHFNWQPPRQTGLLGMMENLMR